MSEKPEHGIAAAYYSSDGQRYRPVLECRCGFTSGRDSLLWEEAGAALDEHLADVTTAASGGGG